MLSLSYDPEEIKTKEFRLKEMIRNAELARIMLYEELTDLQSRLSLDMYPYERQPKCQAVLHPLDFSYVVQLSYEGMLPLYDEDRRYKQEIRDYYIQATFQAVDWNKMNVQFDQGFIYICHCFQNLQIRDLDNRNRKFILDGIRRTRMISNDDWNSVAVMEKGYRDDEKDHIEVFIGDLNYLHQIMDFVSERMSEQNVRTDVRTMSL